MVKHDPGSVVKHIKFKAPLVLPIDVQKLCGKMEYIPEVTDIEGLDNTKGRYYNKLMQAI